MSLNFPAPLTAVGDSFSVYANGEFFANYALTQLPLQIPNFPWNGGAFDEVRVCIHGATVANCCGELEFHVPTCLPYPACDLSQLHVQVGDCNADSTFHVTLNFQVGTPAAVDSFDLWGNAQYLGKFGINQLPLTIPDFDWNGNIFSSIRVCTGSEPGCCREKQFLNPACLPFGPCHVSNITTLNGPCHSNGTYQLTVNFQASNPGNGSYTVYTNNQLYGVFPLTSLPLVIPNFPGSGNANDLIRICINAVPGSTTPCCESKEFQAPACSGNCDIHEFEVTTGECTGDSTYVVHLNFVPTGASTNYFKVFANGTFFGNYTLSQLPLTIEHFPWNGGDHDVIKVCLVNVNGEITCCKELEFAVPACLQGNCEITGLEVGTGDCTGDSTYVVHVNFHVSGSTLNTFVLYANGEAFGTYNLSQLPLTIEHFPWNGGNNDVIKVCLVSPNGVLSCCNTVEFPVPACLQNNNCEITGLEVGTGDCTGDSTYVVHVNFHVSGSTLNTFVLYANGQAFGTYNLSQLPLTIEHFPWNGGNNDVIKVCLVSPNGAVTCCKEIEFPVPACLQGTCAISNVVVDPGACNPTGGYSLGLNFHVDNPGNSLFNVYANGQLIGTFPLASLPLVIPNFPGSGNAVDHIKICINDHPNCCSEHEFQAPVCGGNCDIHDLTVQTGTCEGDSAYHVTVNFIPVGTTATSFELYANGQLFGTYNVSQLPLTIPNFPWNGGNNDVIKVCMVTSNASNTCCKTLEFAVPSCLLGDCEIYNVVVTPGDCHPPNNVYTLVVNFQVQNPGNNQFEVWAGNGQYLGIFPLSALPLTIPNFPWGGSANDHIKICINDNANCCKTVEFPAPTCLGNSCAIHDLTVQTGDCQGDSTYQLYVNFIPVNPPVTTFSVFANGQFYGSFGLNQLPLMIPNFPWNGGNNDVIKICIGAAGALNCCETLEFAVPGCLLEPCHITDLHAIHTPCLCGQFFAVLTFNHANGGAGGFDVVGNGNNYGTFPYNTPQPIIIGPLVGDNSTMYEFSVRDHLHPDCHDGVQLGKVDCPTLLTNSPVSGATLLLSPNPTNDWLNATAILSGGAHLGQSSVQVFHADGRLMMSQLVNDGSSFQLNVSALPAGIYRLALRSDVGNLQGTFTKL